MPQNTCVTIEIYNVCISAKAAQRVTEVVSDGTLMAEQVCLVGDESVQTQKAALLTVPYISTQNWNC
jgi:hypothetical protein